MGRISKTVIACYTLKGKLVKTYPTAASAAKSRHLFKRTIDRCVRGDLKVVKNLQWKRFKVDEVLETIPPLEIKRQNVRVRPVAKLDDNGMIIEIYPSIKNASKLNDLDPHSLRDRLNKKYSYVGKTKFRYLTDNEIIKYNPKIDRVINTKRKRIDQYSLDGKYINTYPSIRNATTSLGKDSKNRGIYQCLKKDNQAFGYIWKYKD